MTIELFIKALAIAFILEGIVPALFPNKWRAYVVKLINESPQNIRRIGITLVLIGSLIFFSV
ncbi:DUF2065 domain-containing protein [Thalassotalea fusca]